MKRRSLAMLAALAVITGVGADWIRPSIRPRFVPGIPKRDYQLIDPGATLTPPTVVGKSLNGVDVMDLVTKQKKLRTFAMDQTTLRSLHCSISHVAFTFDAEGNWILNGQADQNPWFTTQPNAMPPASLGINVETNHLLRNEFTVTMRCYGNWPQPEANKTTGKPALAEIPVSFMVQRGIPYSIRMDSKANADLRKHYEIIDRVEFELSFRSRP